MLYLLESQGVLFPLLTLKKEASFISSNLKFWRLKFHFHFFSFFYSKTVVVLDSTADDAFTLKRDEVGWLCVSVGALVLLVNLLQHVTRICVHFEMDRVDERLKAVSHVIVADVSTPPAGIGWTSVVESSVEGSSVQRWRWHDIMASVHPPSEVVELVSVASVTPPQIVRAPHVDFPPDSLPLKITLATQLSFVLMQLFPEFSYLLLQPAAVQLLLS